MKKGTDVAGYGRSHRLDEKAPIFLKDGYIIVNFNIETIRDGNTARPHLQYIHGPLMNQWQLEGFNRSYTDHTGMALRCKTGMCCSTMATSRAEEISAHECRTSG